MEGDQAKLEELGWGQEGEIMAKIKEQIGEIAKKGRDKRWRVLPTWGKSHSNIGQLVMCFETISNKNVRSSGTSLGTAQIIYKITNSIYVILTCAHNFI